MREREGPLERRGRRYRKGVLTIEREGEYLLRRGRKGIIERRRKTKGERKRDFYNFHILVLIQLIFLLLILYIIFFTSCFRSPQSK